MASFVFCFMAAGCLAWCSMDGSHVSHPPNQVIMQAMANILALLP